MPSNLSKSRKLLVVSDTGMIDKNGKMFAFGPVVKELQEMSNVFDTITWIGFNRLDQIENDSYLEVPLEKIKLIPLKRVGGTSFLDKLKIIKNYPRMLHTIHSEIKKHHFIHVRAPSNPAYISMMLSKNFPHKQFWFKYAGSWVDKTSYFYDLQRKKLKSLSDNCKVTVNGKWMGQHNHILAFENPCLTEEDRILGKTIINNKNLTNKINCCFVGGLNANKGVEMIIEAFNDVKFSNVGVLHIVGDGDLRSYLEQKAKHLSMKVIFHGSLCKEQVQKIYKASHFIILPSKSEGFPKVIGEAMNYGCIPVVSDISCIGQYVKNEKNGFLINPITSIEVKNVLIKCLSITGSTYTNYIDYNYNLADKFSYSYYIKRMQTEIFENH